jgi:hypothetical protein
MRFEPLEDASTFRKMAAAMWNNPSDPTIYGSMDVDVTDTLERLQAYRTRTGLKATLTQVVARVDLETLQRVRYLDERVGLLASASRWRTAWSNVLEALSRANVPGEPQVLLRALRATRWSALDGSYGLALSPEHRHLLSAHRGLNEVRGYRYPSLELHRRVPFPGLQRYFPDLVSPWEDPRLGFHHATLSTTTVPPTYTG